MRVELLHWDRTNEEFRNAKQVENSSTDLVLYFGDREVLSNVNPFDELRNTYPNAQFVGCSGGGQIYNQDVGQHQLVAVAIDFDDTAVKVTHVHIEDPSHSYTAGVAIGEELISPSLSGVILLSDGLNVNGSLLSEGINEAIGARVPVVGGLAGDNDNFAITLIGVNEDVVSHRIAAIGLYGDAIRLGHGSDSGFVPFGPRRKVTKSVGNILFELDGKPALELYKTYLGDEAKDLPGSALHFPLQIWNPADPTNSVIRTVLATDDDKNSMTFAGDIPEGYVAQLMRSSLERLAASAGTAARTAFQNNEEAELALMVSCVGRRWAMGQRAEEEIDAARLELGTDLPVIGFYSYGEICPGVASGPVLLHNETLTIAVISEHAT